MMWFFIPLWLAGDERLQLTESLKQSHTECSFYSRREWATHSFFSIDVYLYIGKVRGVGREKSLVHSVVCQWKAHVVSEVDDLIRSML